MIVRLNHCTGDCKHKYKHTYNIRLIEIPWWQFRYSKGISRYCFQTTKIIYWNAVKKVNCYCLTKWFWCRIVKFRPWKYQGLRKVHTQVEVENSSTGWIILVYPLIFQSERVRRKLCWWRFTLSLQSAQVHDCDPLKAYSSLQVFCNRLQTIAKLKKYPKV